MFELGEFHLQLAFVGARALRKNIQDQAVAVQYRNSRFFEVALLCGRQVVIDDHDSACGTRHQVAQFFGLALAEKRSRHRALALAGEHGAGIRSSRVHEQAELFEFRIRIEAGQAQLHQQGAFAWTCAPRTPRCEQIIRCLDL